MTLKRVILPPRLDELSTGRSHYSIRTAMRELFIWTLRRAIVVQERVVGISEIDAQRLGSGLIAALLESGRAQQGSVEKKDHSSEHS